MGGQAGTEISVAAGSNTLSAWVNSIEKRRDQIIQAAVSGDHVLATLSEADARADLIEAMSSAIRERLLRITEPKIRMVELVSNPTDDDRVELTAYAILAGLKLGQKQFGIFGGGYDKQAGSPRPGTLYIKAAGYRQLFAHLGVVVKLQPGLVRHSSELDRRNRPVWICEGRATCYFQGREYERIATADSPILIKGHDSGEGEAVQGKLKTRLLKDLYEMVSPLLAGAAGESDGDVVDGVIEVQALIPEAKGDAARQYPGEVMAVLEKYSIEGKADVLDYLHLVLEAISAADSVERLDEIRDDVLANYKAAGLTKTDLKPIAEWRDSIQASLQADQP